MKDLSTSVVVITGASGYIGKHLVAELIRQGNDKIRVLSRNKCQDLADPQFGSSVEVVECDISDPGALQSLLVPGCTVFNLVYQWNAGEVANLAATQRLLDACAFVGVRRLIHFSTAAVVGRVQDDRVTESTICRPITKYGTTKLKIEQSIIEKSLGKFDTIILRATFVFEIEVISLKKLVVDLLQGNLWKNFSKSCLFGKRRMNLVHVNNVVAAMIFLLRSEKKFDGEVFIVSDDDAPNNNFVSVEKRLMQIFEIDDYRLPRLRLPLQLLSFLLSLLGRNNVNPRCDYDSSKLLAMGFKRPVDFDEGLTEYASWYRSEYLTLKRDAS